MQSNRRDDQHAADATPQQDGDDSQQCQKVTITARRLRQCIITTGLRLGLGYCALVELAHAVCEDLLMDDYCDPAEAREQRDRAVRAEFDGTNRDAVMRKHGISQATFYRILQRGRRRPSP